MITLLYPFFWDSAALASLVFTFFLVSTTFLLPYPSPLFDQ